MSAARYFWDHTPDRDIALTMDINALAPMYVTLEFLPDMMADAGRPRRILNVASAAGTVSNPRMSVYAASKWAVIGWSDSLRLELEQQGYGHLKVTTFCPSYISTGMFEGARGPLLTPLMTPEDAVDRAWRATARRAAAADRPGHGQAGQGAARASCRCGPGTSWAGRSLGSTPPWTGSPAGTEKAGTR